MCYTTKVRNILSEKACDKDIKNYLRESKALGENYACMTFLLDDDMQKSLSSFIRDDNNLKNRTSFEIALVLLKYAILIWPVSMKINSFTKKAVGNVDTYFFEQSIDKILIDKELKKEIIKLIYRRNDSSPYSLFESLNYDDEYKEKILNAISIINNYQDAFDSSLIQSKKSDKSLLKVIAA